MRKSSTEEFITKAKEVHGDEYSYELVEYKNNCTKVRIICPEHGVFEQRPNDHLNDHGCPKCRYIKSGKSNALSTEEFIVNAIGVHGSKYDYSLVEYVNACTKVKIICPIHGVFEQTPGNHVSQGQGCPKCRYIKSGKSNALSSEEFITKARKVHGSKYDYSLVEYVNNKTKVKIICPEHGEFEQAPSSHYINNGCPVCFGKGKDINGINPRRSTTEEFIINAIGVHGSKYDYSLVEYVNNKTKVKIICPEHGEFEQAPYNHLKGRRCPVCTKQISKQEIEFTDYIKSVYDGTVIANSRRVIPPYELDVYLPDLAIAFEYNGMYWHNEGVTKPYGYHDMKTDRCREVGVKLHHVWEDAWMSKREDIMSEIKKMFGDI